MAMLNLGLNYKKRFLFGEICVKLKRQLESPREIKA